MFLSNIFIILTVMILIVKAAEYNCYSQDSTHTCKCWIEKNKSCSKNSDCTYSFGYDRCCRYGQCIMSSTFDSWSSACGQPCPQ